MATYNHEEEEKIEGLKAWWNRYGTIITVALALSVATVGGTQVWRYYQQQQAQQAADLYALLKQVQETNDVVRIGDAAHLLTKGFPSSGYAARAALIAAKASVEAGDTKRAKDQLQWIFDHAKEPEIKDLARLRLARILLDEQNYPEALRHLSTQHGESFAGLYADLKGDVLQAAGQLDEARLSYQLAVDTLNKNNNYFNIVQMKLDALGEPGDLAAPVVINETKEWIELGKSEDADEADELSEPAESSEAVESVDVSEANEAIEQDVSDASIDADVSSESIETDESLVEQQEAPELMESVDSIESLGANVHEAVEEADMLSETVEEGESVESTEASESDETQEINALDASESDDVDNTAIE